jgi:hypothetical protein
MLVHLQRLANCIELFHQYTIWAYYCHVVIELKFYVSHQLQLQKIQAEQRFHAEPYLPHHQDLTCALELVQDQARPTPEEDPGADSAQRWSSAVDVSYAAPQVYVIANVVLHREYFIGILFIFVGGRKYLYHV